MPALDLTSLGGFGAFLAAWGNWVGLLAFVVLGLWVYWDAHKEIAA
jgi:hypothetical protein